MSKVFIEEATLSSIGDAIREKAGTTELIAPQDMGTAIKNLPSGGGGDIEVEPIVLSGSQLFGCAGKVASNYIELFGDTISTSGITDAGSMFFKYENKNVPFDINCSTTTTLSLSNMFERSLIELAPNINDAKPNSISSIFYTCNYLREIPDDFGVNWNWDYLHTYNYGNCSELFRNCFSLRKIPATFISNGYSGSDSSYYSCYYNTFIYCSTLDEINGLAVVPVTLTSNCFFSTFSLCSRLKDLTFQTNEDGTPKTAKWKNQAIDLNTVGCYDTSLNNIGNFVNYNSGITADKYVYDDATYQALKDDEDWFTTKPAYSRYNHDSAVNTINSLPDCSAYLATAGGTNTIKFKGVLGSATDGGAINTLTEEEIAVATAKGWTVTLS